MRAPEKIQELVKRFQRNREVYRKPQYGEAEIRKEFVDPFFKALGWDIDNERGYAEPYKDVIHEASVRVEGAPKAPDYSFRVGGTRKFFVESKKPAVNLKTDSVPAFQLRRYGWSAGLSLSVLTDFEEFAIYDCQIQPHVSDRASKGRVLYMTCDEYLDRWEEIAGIFTREAVLTGAFDRYAASTAAKRGTSEFDDIFLEEIEGWRAVLARNIALRNPTISLQELNSAVQRTIDRIVFLRICEDRGIEDYGQLRKAAAGPDVYHALVKIFRQADNKYNSGLFHFRRELGREEGPDTLTLGLTIDDEPLQSILGALYYPECPYEFSVIPADILGQVYERFLGSTIRLTPSHRAKVEQKPEVRKAGGVYYTPTFIVDYIVTHTLRPKLEGQRPDQAADLRILDPACGSGHFLVHAYQYLLDWHLTWYVEEGLKHKKYQARAREGPAGDPILTTAEKKRILLNNIYGVDIDAQAVEVTKLSLLLKVLEGETGEVLEAQMRLLAERALPDLASNIKCGNSLIDLDFYSGRQLSLLDEEELYRVNPFSWQKGFPTVIGARGGFDVVLGNPPYILLEDELRDEEQVAYFRKRYRAASFKIDTYHLFMERGLELTANGGLISMITPSNFLTNNYLLELRRLLLTESRIDHILVIDGGVFPGVSVDNAVWLLEKGAETDGPFPLYHTQIESSRRLERTRTSHILVDPEDEHVLFTGGGGPELAALWKRLQKDCQTLGDIAYVNFGKQLRNAEEYPKDTIEVESLGDVPYGYRPCYTGSDIRRYELIWNGLACLDNEVAKQGGTWNPDRQNAKNKILCRQVGEFPFFAHDAEGYQVLNRAFMINLREGIDVSPELLIGLLNSRLLRSFWLDRFYDQRETFPKIKGTYLKKLPIPRLDLEDELQRELVEQIVTGVRTLESLVNRRRGVKTEHERDLLGRQIEAVEEDIDEKVLALYAVDEEVRPLLIDNLPT